MAKIPDKQTMYRLQATGVLGNHLKTYTWHEFLSAKSLADEHCFRHRTRSGSKLFRAHMSYKQTVGYVRRLLIEKRIVENDVVISQGTNNFTRTTQGEVMLDTYGLTYIYSAEQRETETCRESMQRKLVTLCGLRAKMKLLAHMDFDSYSCLWHLLARYPDATVEISCFNKAIGCFGWNTLFWEVRDF